MIKIIEEALRLTERGEPFVIATVVRTIGSTPKRPARNYWFARTEAVWVPWAAAALRVRFGARPK